MKTSIWETIRRSSQVMWHLWVGNFPLERWVFELLSWNFREDSVKECGTIWWPWKIKREMRTSLELSPQLWTAQIFVYWSKIILAKYTLVANEILRRSRFSLSNWKPDFSHVERIFSENIYWNFQFGSQQKETSTEHLVRFANER